MKKPVKKFVSNVVQEKYSGKPQKQAADKQRKTKGC